MALSVKRAKRTESRLRIGFVGPSGTGKTFTSLKLARCLVGTAGRILVVDTERGSASLYADMPDCAGEFDVIELESFAPEKFIECIEYADENRYDVLIIDSLSHAWMGKDGALEMVDAAAAKSRSGNNFAAWREVTPVHNRMVDSMLRARCHVFVTMRAKTEWVIEKDEKGKSVPRKVGMQPVQRDGMEYEFTIVGDLDDSNTWIITKDRTSLLAGKAWRKPGKEVATILSDWLKGAQEPDPTPQVNAEPESDKTPTNGHAAQGEPKIPAAAVPPQNPATPKPTSADRDAIKAIALTLQETIQAMGYTNSDMADVVKSVYNAKALVLCSLATVNEIRRDFEEKANLFGAIKAEVLNSDFGEAFDSTNIEDMARLFDRTHEVLANKACMEYESKPLRAKAAVWKEWLAELCQGQAVSI